MDEPLVTNGDILVKLMYLGRINFNSINQSKHYIQQYHSKIPIKEKRIKLKTYLERKDYLLTLREGSIQTELQILDYSQAHRISEDADSN